MWFAGFAESKTQDEDYVADFLISHSQGGNRGFKNDEETRIRYYTLGRI